MKPSAGLINSLNQIREASVQDGKIYGQRVPFITEDTTIGEFAQPILDTDFPEVMNEFIPALVNRIVYTQFKTKYFNNPLQDLEGEAIPFGYAGQEVYVNPADAVQFDGNDYIGLLQKYEADVKVQYTTVNSDLQYKVTISREQLRTAFTSWATFEDFIGQLSQSLYNGAYINDYNQTKYLIAAAYQANYAPIQIIPAVVDGTTAGNLLKKVKSLRLNFASPSTEFNAWKNAGGTGRPAKIWSDPEDVVLLIRNDVLATTDVDNLAGVFNLSKAEFTGKVYGVDNFDIIDQNGNKVFDGSAIQAAIVDKSWFRIRTQFMYLNQFYNANNETWQLFLHVKKMYNYSLFANGVILATEQPNVPVTSLSWNGATEISINQGESEGLDIIAEPANSTTEVTYKIADSTGAEVEGITLTPSNNGRHVQIDVASTVAAASYTLTATAGQVSETLTVKVVAA